MIKQEILDIFYGSSARQPETGGQTIFFIFLDKLKRYSTRVICEKDPSNRIGELINFITLPDDAIPYREGDAKD